MQNTPSTLPCSEGPSAFIGGRFKVQLRLNHLLETSVHNFRADSLPGVLLYDECDSIGTACDLGLLDLASEKQELYLASEENERQGAISPMQQLVAYESDVTGQPEIWVRPYPDVGRDKRMISRNGGRQPMWAADGSALYFIGVVGNQNWLMSVAVIDAKGFVFGEKERTL